MNQGFLCQLKIKLVGQAMGNETFYGDALNSFLTGMKEFELMVWCLLYPTGYVLLLSVAGG